VMMAPAPRGTGIIAGGPMRAVFEVLGITDIVAKSHGVQPYNMVRATLDALKNCTTPRSGGQARQVGRRHLHRLRSDGMTQQTKTVKVQLVRSPIGCKRTTAPPCVAWACASSTACASCRTRPRCAA
jgi:hypothetical protein